MPFQAFITNSPVSSEPFSSEEEARNAATLRALSLAAQSFALMMTSFRVEEVEAPPPAPQPRRNGRAVTDTIADAIANIPRGECQVFPLSAFPQYASLRKLTSTLGNRILNASEATKGTYTLRSFRELSTLFTDQSGPGGAVWRLT